jgi:hypothetical protein
VGRVTDEAPRVSSVVIVEPEPPRELLLDTVGVVRQLAGDNSATSITPWGPITMSSSRNFTSGNAPRKAW